MERLSIRLYMHVYITDLSTSSTLSKLHYLRKNIGKKNGKHTESDE